MRYRQGKAHVLVWFNEVERGWVFPLGGGRYRVDNVPVRDGLNIDDVVTLVRRDADPGLIVDEVVESPRGGKLVVAYDSHPEYRRIRLRAMACGCEAQGFPLDQPAEHMGLCLIAYPRRCDGEALRAVIVGPGVDHHAG